MPKKYQDLVESLRPPKSTLLCLQENDIITPIYWDPVNDTIIRELLQTILSFASLSWDVNLNHKKADVLFLKKYKDWRKCFEFLTGSHGG